MAADQTIKKLLIKMGLSTSSFKNDIQEIKRQLGDVNRQAKIDADALKQSQKEQLAITKQQIADQQRLTAEARAMTAVDQAKAQWQRKQQEVLRTQVAQRVLETAELKKQQQQQVAGLKLEQERLKIAQQQFRLTQQQTREQEREQRKQQQPGIFGALGRAASNLAGGGMLGAVAGGALTGGLFGAGAVEVINIMAAKLHELVHALAEATGPAQTLRQEFVLLSQKAGIDATQQLNKLRVATRGLISDMDLFKIANNFMRQGMKVSSDQMARLVADTVNLARGMGKTAPEVARALEMAFLNPQRGMMILARTTGIQVQQLRKSMQGIPASVDPATRATLMFNTVLREEEKMLQRVGVPATTLPELFQQISNAEQNFLDDMAAGVLEGGQFGKTIDEMSHRLMALQPTLEAVATWLGKTLVGAASGFIQSTEIIIGTVDNLSGALLKSVVYMREFVEISAAMAKGPAGAGADIALAMDKADQSIARIDAHTKSLVDSLDIFGEQARKRAQEADPFGLKGMMSGLGLSTAPTTPETPESETIAQQKKEAEQQKQIAELMAKAKLALAKETASRQEAIIKEQYDTGVLSLVNYIGQERTIKAAEYQATLEEIRKEEDAQLTAVKKESGVTIDGVAIALKTAKDRENATTIIHDQAQLKRIQAETKYNSESAGLTKQLVDDQQAAYQTYVDAINKVNREGVQERIKVLETEFKQGRVDAEDYIIQRKSLIEEEFQLVATGLDQKLKANKDNAREIAKIQSEVVQAQIDHERQLTEFSQQQDDLRLKALENHYAQAKKYLEVEVATGKARPGGAGLETAATESLMALSQRYMNELQQQQRALESEGKKYSDDWININEALAQAIQDQQKLNLELAKARDTAAPLGNIFGSFAQLAGVFKGPGATGVAGAFENVSKSMTQMSQFTIANRAAGSGGVFGAFGSSVKSLFGGGGTPQTAGKTAMQVFEGSLSTSANTVHTMSSAAETAAAQLRALAEAAQRDITALSSKSGTSSTVPMNTSLEPPHMQWGGMITGSGLAMVHEGEVVSPASTAPLPSPDASGLPISNSFSGLTAVVQSLTKSMEASVTHVSSFGEKLTDVAGSLGNIVQGVGGALQGMLGGKTGAGGALGGAMGMGQLGMSVGSMAGPMGSAIGLGIGSVVGGVMGGIFGSKEKQLQQEMHEFQAQLQNIVDALNSGTISMTQALVQLRAERQQAVAVLSQNPKGGKGGGKGGKKGFSPSQAQSVIDQIDAEIAQVYNQQQEVLSQLNQQLDIVSQPYAFQQYAQSLDQIIQKYQEFMSAAQGSAQEVGNAQQYLNASLQQYVYTLGTQLNQAQQQSIQDAMTLLNLEYQRQQIINQEAQQQYDILTQGVLTRQRTTAMTKGQEIGQLQYQMNMQLEQINEQIALQQYKVQTEEQIFNLATTRIGLETQLLTLQEQQADQQNQQTAALAQVVSALQQGMASGSLMNQISGLYSQAGGAMPTGAGVLTTALNTLGLNAPVSTLTGPGGATQQLGSIPAEYQGIANFVASIDPDFLSNLLSAMSTSAGSQQRAAVAQEASQYTQDANTSGFNMAPFVSWIQTGAAIQQQSFQNQPANIPGGPMNLPQGTGFTGPTAASTSPIVTIPGALSGQFSFATPTGPAGTTGGIASSSQVGQSLATVQQQTANMQMQVVSAQTTLLQQQQQYLTNLSAVLEQLENLAGLPGGGGLGLEDMLQQVYQVRGRFGGGVYTRQQL